MEIDEVSLRVLRIHAFIIHSSVDALNQHLLLPNERLSHHRASPRRLELSVLPLECVLDPIVGVVVHPTRSA